MLQNDVPWRIRGPINYRIIISHTETEMEMITSFDGKLRCELLFLNLWIDELCVKSPRTLSVFIRFVTGKERASINEISPKRLP